MKLKKLAGNRISRNTMFLSVCALFLFGFLLAGQSFGATAKEIDAAANAAMERFFTQVEGSKAVAERAKGLLVLPNVKKGALIVGAEYGQGALRIGGKTVDYYSITAGSIGLQIGGQARDIVIAFMSEDSLKKFRASKGWEAGADGNLALVTLGAGERADTKMANEPIVAYVFDVKGLMADMSLRGAKFNKLDLKE